MQVNCVGRHLGMLGLYYSNVTAMSANTDVLGSGFQVLSNMERLCGSYIPCEKSNFFPLDNGDNLKYCIILSRNCSHITWGCFCPLAPSLS